MHSFLISAAAFIVLVGLIVILHELGHFVMAKLFGVRVEAFSFGFGPRLFGFKYGDTDYKVCLLPLGGFVKMTGENITEESADEIASDPAAFTSNPRWQRMLIGLAGPVVNFLLALVLMFFYYAFFNEVPSVTVKDTVVEWVTPGSAAADAGIQTGDIVRGFGDVSQPDLGAAGLRADQAEPRPVCSRGCGPRRYNALTCRSTYPRRPRQKTSTSAIPALQPQYLPGPIQVAQVQPGTPAEQAGLRAGDQIEAVDGHAFHSTNTLLAYMQWEQGKPMTLTLLRNGVTVQITATPAKSDTR